MLAECRSVRARIAGLVMTGGLVGTVGFHPLMWKVTTLISVLNVEVQDGFAPTLSKCAALSGITGL